MVSSYSSASPSPDHPHLGGLLQDLAKSYAAAGDFWRAKDCYMQAAAQDPQDPAPLLALGVLAVQNNHLAEATAAFRSAAKCDVRCSEAYGGLAMVHQKLGQFPQALDLYLKCLELNNDNLVALLGLFQTSCHMGTFAKIIHYLEVYLEAHPQDVSVLFCLASLYAREGKLLSARHALHKVLALEPEKGEARDLLAQVHGALQKQVFQQTQTA